MTGRQLREGRFPEDPGACGLGLGAECCAYLMAGPEGLECGRVSEAAGYLRRRASAGQMHARRLPLDPYPDCQLHEEDADGPAHD